MLSVGTSMSKYCVYRKKNERLKNYIRPGGRVILKRDTPCNHSVFIKTDYLGLKFCECLSGQNLKNVRSTIRVMSDTACKHADKNVNQFKVTTWVSNMINILHQFRIVRLSN